MGSMVGLTSTYVRSFSRAISVTQDILHSGFLKSTCLLKTNFEDEQLAMKLVECDIKKIALALNSSSLLFMPFAPNYKRSCNIVISR